MQIFSKSFLLPLIMATASLSMEACTTRLGDFTVLGTKNVDVGGLKPGDRFSGEDCGNYLFMFIPITRENWKNAMDQALERGKGDVLLDIVLTRTGWVIPYLWSQECVVMEGTVSQSASFKR